MTVSHTTRITGIGRVYPLALLVILLSQTPLAQADAWLDAGDSALRHDVQFLVDTGVIDLPLTAWPIPSADVAWALEEIADQSALSAGQLGAIRRIKRRLSIFTHDTVRLSARVSGAGNPQVLRGFENTPREEGEIGASVSASSQHFSGRLSVAYVIDPDDDKSVRLDGTYGTARLGNWLFTAGALDRWWGPSWDGSLILSNNARPIPALSIDRESSRGFESPWLSWIGPWRLSTFMGQMEDEREDRDHPLLFGMRITARPFGNIRVGSVHPLRGIELAVERTAQWCAEGLPCDWDAFWNMFTGDDSFGDTVGPEDEPGNQLAGWTIRWASPFAKLPVALYRQKTSESIHSSELKLGQPLNLWGAEIWGATSAGLSWRLHAEYAATACGEPSTALFDCAYNNNIFNVEGYRYRGRPVGHSMDGDGRSYTVGLNLAGSEGWTGMILLRKADLNRGGVVPDTRNTVAQEPMEFRGVELSANFSLADADLAVGLGYDQTTVELTEERDSTVRGFLTYQYRF